MDDDASDALQDLLRAMTDFDPDDEYLSEGEVDNTYGRTVRVRHRIGRVWVTVLGRGGDRMAEVRLNQEQAKQLTLLLTENLR